MNKRISSFILALATAFFCNVASAQQLVSMDDARLTAEDSLIRNFLLVSDKNSLRYSLTGSAAKGVKLVEVASSDKILMRKECGGATDCSVSGAAPLSMLPSSVITARVADSQGNEQKEKIKINMGQDETKIYFVGSLPGIIGTAPMVFASAGQNPSEGASGTVPQVVTPPEKKIEELVQSVEGPKINVKIDKLGDNDYMMRILSQDPSGVDFIEILENDSFLDVETCDSKQSCSFDKRIQNRTPGRNKYLIKSMDSSGALSFIEEVIIFTK